MGPIGADKAMPEARRFAILALAAMTLTACGSEFITDDTLYTEDLDFAIDEESRILDTVESREVLDVLAKYRVAVVKKDFGALNRLVSDDYYDNASTTNTTRDDYGREGLSETFELMAQHADSIQYKVTVKGVEIERGLAHIDYEYTYAYQFKVGDEVAWDSGTDVNRVELKRVEGEWKIVAGL